jgi:hypothetical protein
MGRQRRDAYKRYIWLDLAGRQLADRLISTAIASTDLHPWFASDTEPALDFYLLGVVAKPGGPPTHKDDYSDVLEVLALRTPGIATCRLPAYNVDICQ